MKKIIFCSLLASLLIGCSQVYGGNTESGKEIREYELDSLPNGDFIAISSGSGGAEDIYYKLKSNKQIEEAVSRDRCYFYYINEGESVLEIVGSGIKAKYHFYINLENNN